MQFGYEDRIAELRAQVDRISSRQLLDQEQYEQKLDRCCAGRRRSSRAPARSAACPTRRSPARSSRRRAAAASIAPRRTSPRRSATRAPSCCRPTASTCSIRARCRCHQERRRHRAAPSSRACRPRSTASSSARPQRSVRSRRSWNTRRGASAACSPISASTRARPRTAGERVAGIGGPFVPARRRRPSRTASTARSQRIRHRARAMSIG